MLSFAYIRTLVLGTSFALVASMNAASAADTTPPPTPATQETPSGTTTPATPETPPTTDPANATEKKPGDEIVCRKEPPATGSRIGARKICRTAREWIAIQAEARAVTEDLQRTKIPNSAN